MADKVYEYDGDAVREKLVRAFRTRAGEATVADIASVTGLPLAQIDAELPALSDEYGARLKVAESGDLLYSFPGGMKSRYKGFSHGLARFWKTAKKALVAAGKVLFKVWIVATLLGYFALFVGLALFALVASIAIQQGGSRDSRDDRRGGGLGGLWLTGRLFDAIVRIWFYSELFKDPNDRYRRAEARKAKKPLHKAVFSHVFGDGDPNPDWAEVEKKAVIAFLQTHKGIITLPEFMALTGLAPGEAEIAINRYMLEFEGSPEVSEGGALYYAFPKLLARVGETPAAYASTSLLKRLERFSSNTPKADRTFSLINLANVVFGSYFLYNAMNVGLDFIVATPRGYALRGGFAFLYSSTGYLFSQILSLGDPVLFIASVLGVVPLAFSVCFFAIPLIRKSRMLRRNEELKTQNLRRFVYRSVLESPKGFRPETVSVQVEEARPAAQGATEVIADELAAWSEASVSRDAGFRYDYDDIERTQREAVKLRAAIDLSKFAPGKTVFDSGE